MHVFTSLHDDNVIMKASTSANFAKKEKREFFILKFFPDTYSCTYVV